MKKCPKCGQMWPDTDEFCTNCGTKLYTADVEQKNIVLTKEEKDNKFVDIRALKKLKRKRRMKIICGCIGFAITIVAGGAFLGKNLFKPQKNNAVIYGADGQYEIIKNLRKPNAIEIGDTKSENLSSYDMEFDAEGKYVYYLTKYDSGCGSLMRCEYRKLKKTVRKMRSIVCLWQRMYEANSGLC